jgi:hypothetical protein
MSVLDRAKRFLWNRRYSYRSIFNSPPGKIVLADLAVFCRAAESTFHDNERVQSKLDGRREVWLRIQQHLQLTEDQLWEVLDGRTDNVS